MSRPAGADGIIYWFRVVEWLRMQKHLLQIPPYEAMEKIRQRFEVSRATAYRYLAAYRDADLEDGKDA